jgi:hypothetical protein
MTSTGKTAARREAIIMVLLAIVGAVLAFLLFAAAALWRGRSSAERPKTSIKYSPRGEKPEPSRRTTRASGCGFDPHACYGCVDNGGRVEEVQCNTLAAKPGRVNADNADMPIVSRGPTSVQLKRVIARPFRL